MVYLKGQGIPQVYCFGTNDKYNILIVQLLNKSLDSLFISCNKKFSIPSVCMLGIQMVLLLNKVERIKHIHEHHHIHRDIKPENFMIGLGKEENLVYLIDYGLAKKYRSSTTKEHIPFRKNKSLTGTARYASINTHKGYGML